MICNYTLRSDPSSVFDVGFIRTKIIFRCEIFAILYISRSTRYHILLY